MHALPRLILRKHETSFQKIQNSAGPQSGVVSLLYYCRKRSIWTIFRVSTVFFWMLKRMPNCWGWCRTGGMWCLDQLWWVRAAMKVSANWDWGYVWTPSYYQSPQPSPPVCVNTGHLLLLLSRLLDAPLLITQLLLPLIPPLFLYFHLLYGFFLNNQTRRSKSLKGPHDIIVVVRIPREQFFLLHLIIFRRHTAILVRCSGYCFSYFW